MPDTLTVLAVVTALAIGYIAGRLRPGKRLLSWAEDRSSGSHGPGWWAAQVIGLAAITWMLSAHPRRSAANRRSWREARNTPRAPAPTFDPRWIKRQDDTDA